MDDNVILTVAVVLAAGVASGQLAKRFKLPSVTGQILFGVVIGQSGFELFSVDDAHRLKPVIDFALGLMAVAVGSHLQFKRLMVARRRLVAQVVLEATITPLLVGTCVMMAPNTSWHMAVLLASIAIATAPATILALVKETRSKGVFVKTLIASVALNNLACICVFELAHAAVRASLAGGGGSVGAIVMAPIREIGFSLLLGGGVGLALIGVTRRVVRPDRLSALSLIAILLTVGLGIHFGVSTLLACLFLGMVLANLTPDKEEIGHEVFDNFEYAIYAIFFTVAGMELSFKQVIPGGALAIVVFAARMIGKFSASNIAMRISGATERVRRWLGPALIPQAGLAVGLMLLVTEDEVFAQHHELTDLFLAVVLTVVLVAEIIGPIMTRTALRRSGDYGKDRARVIDFLHEEQITTKLQGPGKAEAIAQLVELAIRTNDLKIEADELTRVVMERETEGSTCVGAGLAIPHARLDVTDTIVGAMGISHDGLRIETPDGARVHCMVLLITPASERDRHLEVLSALARSIGRDRAIQQQLYHIDTPAHAYELLHADEESEDFNYFLDDEE